MDDWELTASSNAAACTWGVNENLEKEAFRVDSSQSLNTRMMYLDLIDFVS
ncbi:MULTISPECIES: hypothetical protein [unclassified Fibrobacter]|uniref:hypothetical protein n=1 Tax=unclassified Fibrobacter TaxID=2634177 RepID=UPI001304804A|nr:MULTISPECIES: hypothetical protein [unclassified Fibrobacter]